MLNPSTWAKILFSTNNPSNLPSMSHFPQGHFPSKKYFAPKHSKESYEQQFFLTSSIYSSSTSTILLNLVSLYYSLVPQKLLQKQFYYWRWKPMSGTSCFCLCNCNSCWATRPLLCCCTCLPLYASSGIFWSVYIPSWYLITDSQTPHLGMAPAVHRSHKENLMSFLGFACNRGTCVWHRAARY